MKISVPDCCLIGRRVDQAPSPLADISARSIMLRTIFLMLVIVVDCSIEKPRGVTLKPWLAEYIDRVDNVGLEDAGN